MSFTFPNESSEHRAAREKLLEKEVEERRASETLAATRRELPPGGVLKEDYVFEGASADGALKKITLSEPFTPGKDSLIISRPHRRRPTAHPTVTTKSVANETMLCISVEFICEIGSPLTRKI